MEIRYLSPYWGQEDVNPGEFIAKSLETGYTGIEINPKDEMKFVDELQRNVANVQSNTSFIVVAQQVLSQTIENAQQYTSRMLARLNELAFLKPDFINSHTGKDYFSFDDNCRIIEAALNFSSKTGIRVLHETHRGRFSFHLATLVSYLDRFPELELVGDFSHFCVVSESLLEDQQHLLDRIIPHISHLHARVGFSQAPQVNDPAAPEWTETVNQYTKWWQTIVDEKIRRGNSQFTITPEFGPMPYMPAYPFTQKPLSDQSEINVFMMKHLQARIAVNV